MKRILLLISALMLSIVVLWAHDVEIDGIYYNLDEENKIAEVTYKGNFYSNYKGKYIGNVVIPSYIEYNSEKYTVTSIGEKAFYKSNKLINVIIPNTVTSIGDYAFYGCENLKNLNYNVEDDEPEVIVPEVEAPAADKTTFLFQIEGAGCEEFDLYLMGINGVWYDAEETRFSRVEGSKEWFQVTVPALDDTQSNFKIRANGDWTYEPKQGYIFLDDAEYYVTAGADGGNQNNLMVLAPTGGQVIALKVIEFVTPCAIENRSVIIGDENQYADSILIIPNSVVEIGKSAFEGCINLAFISISNRITSIEGRTFYGCTNLQEIVIGDNVNEIKDNAFNGCTNLTSISIPESVVSIGAYAFKECSSLSYINVPNNVYSLEEGIFYGCTNLQEFVIGNNVNEIKDNAFYGCSSLTSITIPSSIVSIGSSVFDDCSSLSSINWNAKNFKYNFKFENEVFYISPFDGITHQITSFTIGEDVENIPVKLCYNMTNLKEITIPNSVKSIGASAFFYCSSLSTINIPENVQSIGKSAFSYCASLSSINIPENVQSIGKSAFSYCASLSSINIPNNVQILNDYTFYGCTALKSLVLGESVEEIGNNAFGGCNKLIRITSNSKVVPNLYSSESFAWYKAILSVPCDLLMDYKLDYYFSSFEYIECISADEVVSPDKVEIEVDKNNNATVTWPSTEGANSYELVISKDGVVFCTLVFNANGQLSSIDFGTRAAEVGFQFTVIGLDAASKYNYVMSAQDKSGNEIESYSGTFTTEGYDEGDITQIDETLVEEYSISVSNGFVNCKETNFTIYNTIGQDVTPLNGSLNSGVYVVQVNDERVKVMVK